MVLGALAVVLRQKWPALVPLWLCYILLLLPVFRDGFPVEQVFADRFTYLAALPWALLIGGCAERGLYVVAVRGMRTPVVVSCASHRCCWVNHFRGAQLGGKFRCGTTLRLYGEMLLR